MCVSDVAVIAKLSIGDPSPQFTVTVLIFDELDTVNVTVTVEPVLVGFGVGEFTVTVGPV